MPPIYIYNIHLQTEHSFR